jgi:3-isopropylmalate/(R)-2-methylmalate dehydratase small subunit
MSAQAFTIHQGVVAPLLRANIDTDAIIPSREMKRVSRTGLGVGLFAGWRYLSASERQPDPGFVLNQAAYAGTSIIAAGKNFGCGSSREHAVWALVEFGIRVILAPSFGAIFERNCVNNGLLPVNLPEADIARLLACTEADPQQHRLTVDLQHCSLATGNGYSGSFSMAATQREMLLLGLDPIALTLQQPEAIDNFQREDAQQRPWVYRWRAPLV